MCRMLFGVSEGACGIDLRRGRRNEGRMMPRALYVLALLVGTTTCRDSLPPDPSIVAAPKSAEAHQWMCDPTPPNTWTGYACVDHRYAIRYTLKRSAANAPCYQLTARQYGSANPNHMSGPIPLFKVGNCPDADSVGTTRHMYSGAYSQIGFVLTFPGQLGSIFCNPAEVNDTTWVISGFSPTLRECMDFEVDMQAWYQPSGVVDCAAREGPTETRARVRRGNVIWCSYLGKVAYEPDPVVQRWRFIDANGDSVIAVTADTNWVGPAAMMGLVSVDVIRDSIVGTSASAPVIVRPRNWGWSDAQWSFVEDAPPICVSRRPDNADPAGTTYAANARARDTSFNCQPLRIDPDVRRSPYAGFTIRAATSGPNTGLWFVDTAFYRSERVSSMNPEIRANGPTYQLPEGTQAQECRNRMRLPAGAPVFVNQYSFNETCKRVGLSQMFNGIWDHEGFGSRNGNGHEAQGRIAARDLNNDPYRGIEAATARSDADLKFNVAFEVDSRDQAISVFSGDHNVVSNNWCGSIWIWNSLVNAYQLTQVLMPNGRCL